MKNTIRILVIVVILLSFARCDNKPANIDYGRVTIVSPGNTPMEITMKKQLVEYMRANINDDMERFKKYVYDDIFNYTIKINTGEDLSKEKLCDELAAPMRALKNKAYSHGINCNISIHKSSLPVYYESFVIYVTETHINTSQGTTKRSLVINMIGVSNDNGINWTFIQKDDEMVYKKVLLLKFPTEVIELI